MTSTSSPMFSSPAASLRSVGQRLVHQSSLPLLLSYQLHYDGKVCDGRFLFYRSHIQVQVICDTQHNTNNTAITPSPSLTTEFVSTAAPQSASTSTSTSPPPAASACSSAILSSSPCIAQSADSAEHFLHRSDLLSFLSSEGITSKELAKKRNVTIWVCLPDKNDANGKDSRTSQANEVAINNSNSSSNSNSNTSNSWNVMFSLWSMECVPLKTIPTPSFITAQGNKSPLTYTVELVIQVRSRALKESLSSLQPQQLANESNFAAASAASLSTSPANSSPSNTAPAVHSNAASSTASSKSSSTSASGVSFASQKRSRDAVRSSDALSVDGVDDEDDGLADGEELSDSSSESAETDGDGNKKLSTDSTIRKVEPKDDIESSSTASVNGDGTASTSTLNASSAPRKRPRALPAETIGDIVDRIAEYKKLRSKLGSRDRACAALGFARATICSYMCKVKSLQDEYGLTKPEIEQQTYRSLSFKELRQLMTQKLKKKQQEQEREQFINLNLNQLYHRSNINSVQLANALIPPATPTPAVPLVQDDSLAYGSNSVTNLLPSSAANSSNYSNAPAYALTPHAAHSSGPVSVHYSGPPAGVMSHAMNPRDTYAATPYATDQYKDDRSEYTFGNPLNPPMNVNLSVNDVRNSGRSWPNVTSAGKAALFANSNSAVGSASNGLSSSSHYLSKAAANAGSTLLSSSLNARLAISPLNNMMASSSGSNLSIPWTAANSSSSLNNLNSLPAGDPFHLSASGYSSNNATLNNNAATSSAALSLVHHGNSGAGLPATSSSIHSLSMAH